MRLGYGAPRNAGAPSARRGRHPVVSARRAVALGALLWSLLLLGIFATGPAVAAAPEVGDPAPDFTLPATTGGTISLSQFRGTKAVLLEFYGADFYPV